ncbi:MAG: tetratricopeptide repeat protein [Janthinobacterium lividum]
MNHPPRSAAKLAAIPAGQWAALLASPPAELAPWLEAAANLGDVQAQAAYAQLLLDGRGVERNAERARALFARAALQNDAMAMNMLGRCLEHGWGGAVDLAAAAHWFHAAAQAGLDWGMYNYANLVARGHGLLPGPAAAQAIDSSAEQADLPVAHCRAQAEALAWYRRAAELGHAKSLNMVGRYTEEGIGVEANRNAAFALYRASAEAGDFRGQYSYACMLAERGRIDQAAAWLARIPASATPAFLDKIAQELQLSAHPQFRQFAMRLLTGA